MSIRFSNVVLPLDCDIIDVCEEFQSKGIVVSISHDSPFPRIKFHTSANLSCHLIEIREITRKRGECIEEYIFQLEDRSVVSVYGDVAASIYCPSTDNVKEKIMSTPSVTFLSKSFAKSFTYYSQEIENEIIPI
jgi:hypothetical protein